jgi:hypothetical protein
MKQAMIAHIKNPGAEHFDTPDYGVLPLVRYINPAWKVWEPTDTTGASRITEVLRRNGNRVVSTGKRELDFLRDKAKFRYDCIITNPPYPQKDEFIERCIELKAKWALLLPITALEGVRRGRMFQGLKRQFGVLVLDRRIEYTGESVWFNSSWFCYGILPHQLVFTRLGK